MFVTVEIFDVSMRLGCNADDSTVLVKMIGGWLLHGWAASPVEFWFAKWPLFSCDGEIGSNYLHVKLKIIIIQDYVH